MKAAASLFRACGRACGRVRAIARAGFAAVARASPRALACCLWLVSTAALAQQPNYRLEIDAPDELVAPLRTQTLIGRWRTDSNFERSQLDLFVERAHEEALAIARAAGFFSAKVSVTRSDRDGARGASDGSRPGVASAAGGTGAPDGELPLIRIEVDAGARTTVNRVRLELTGPAAQEAAVEALLEDLWPLPEGSFFRTTEWELGKRQLLEQLQQRGYLRASIADSRADVDPENTTAALKVTVASGPRLSFGEMNVRGLERYPRSIVEGLLPWRPGEPYGFETLGVFQDRLRASGHFTGATVLPDLAAVEADPTRTSVPINVEVREMQAQRVTLGVGFSTDQGVRALLGYEHRNVLGRGWIVESGVLAETVRRRVFAVGRTPYDADGHRFQGGARSERADVSGELVETNTIYFGRGKRTEDIEYFVSLQYQTEQRKIDSETGLIPDQRAALSLGYAWAMRRVDSRIDPRSGYTLSGQLSGALRGVGSDRTFARMYGRAMRFWPMPAGTPLAGGLLVGLVEAGWVVAGSRNDIPSENLFRAGGAQSIRGYDYQSLGVREENATVGGRVLALASLEYQHPITGNWYGAAFVDVGNAADRWDAYKAVRGAGVGLRWRSPVGPINLDVAYGEATRDWRVHFSVGYTF